ncbi:haloacid dehalogenase-like hydrolase [Rhodospirillum rubrum F11]|uniref:phosphoglycolate phosphatase n=3 Tax=Rhodospirillum rubrum TaxID=1085 RepID=Q2RSY9_RHORT|nr:HAD family hydrolase [Rhodospirillum rubrum]ABC22756.1 Haloacid dehalogenase-like hydrolase [Rhodospirillum rubrum ATCC 11170]AEO48477.1 haloacid dehalogenase-like hydrolase [Rhodospirillum rubrum F11]MBK5954353.1 HAD family hydrolase [Rhodospirillum rubrum]QXG78748.1 HAD hydrolase-like protein [Rhodospirillum rubrum]
MNGLAAMILDRDGTTLDFSAMYLAFMNGLYQRAGLEAPSAADLLRYETWERIIAGELWIGTQRVLDIVDDIPRRHMDHGLLFPGVAQGLRRARADGLRLILVSAWVGSAATRALLAREGVLDAFCAVWTADDLGDLPASTSPVPVKQMLVERAVAHLGVDPEHCLMVGDSPDDILAGARLGMRTAMVRTGNGARFADIILPAPDLVADSLTQLLARLYPPSPLASHAP